MTRRTLLCETPAIFGTTMLAKRGSFHAKLGLGLKRIQEYPRVSLKNIQPLWRCRCAVGRRLPKSLCPPLRCLPPSGAQVVLRTCAPWAMLSRAHNVLSLHFHFKPDQGDPYGVIIYFLSHSFALDCASMVYWTSCKCVCISAHLHIGSPRQNFHSSQSNKPIPHHVSRANRESETLLSRTFASKVSKSWQRSMRIFLSRPCQCNLSLVI